MTHLHMPMKATMAVCFGFGNDNRSKKGTYGLPSAASGTLSMLFHQQHVGQQAVCKGTNFQRCCAWSAQVPSWTPVLTAVPDSITSSEIDVLTSDKPIKALQHTGTTLRTSGDDDVTQRSKESLMIASTAVCEAPLESKAPLASPPS